MRRKMNFIPTICLLLGATQLVVKGQLTWPSFDLNNPFKDLSNWPLFNCLTDNPLVAFEKDVGRTTCQIVQARGFHCEAHLVTTSQGYQIELHRILRTASSPPRKYPVILQTGLLGTSADFIMASQSVNQTDTSTMGPNMGLELAKRGFDVWLSNNRGSRYGQTSDRLSPSDPAFWDFSFQDISQFDTPDIVESVRNLTSSKKVHYIGHSQGSAIMFALLSQTDHLNDRIASFIAISPITRLGDAHTLFRPFLWAIQLYLRSHGPIFGEHNFFTDELVPLSCSVAAFRPLCELVFFSVTGPDCTQLEKDRIPVYLDHLPTSTSRKNLLHFHQLFQSNAFRKFDYGETENMKRYNQTVPPEFNLQNITHPSVYIIYGVNDWFVPMGGVKALMSDLRGKAKEFYELTNQQANHMDPLIGKESAPEVNYKVLEILAANE